MRVYSPALSSAAAEYLSAINAGATGQALKGARRTAGESRHAGAAIAELERTREISLSIPWPAPQDGEILERNAVNGMRAGPGDVLFRIADHRLVWVLLDVAERDLAQIAVGTKVTVRPRALPGRDFTGEVALIYPHLNAQTRTARIRDRIAEPRRSAAARHVCRCRNRDRHAGPRAGRAGERRARQRQPSGRSDRQGRRPL